MSFPATDVDEWSALLRRLGSIDAATVAALGEAILDSYGDSARSYHTVEHLAEVLSAIDEIEGDSAGADVVRLAAWYHDLVHEPAGSGDDEERSAERARSELTSVGMSPSLVDEVVRLVRLTASHSVDPSDRLGVVMCDADLWILGAGVARYERYRRDVRTEYGHLSDGIWRVGRAEVIAAFLDRPVLYHSDPGRGREQQARTNLTGELSSLAR